MSSPDEQIVATCEAAVTYLTDHGLARGSYLAPDQTACTAGALLIAHLGGVQNLASGPAINAALGTCHAIPAVAAVIRERHPERHPARGVEPSYKYTLWPHVVIHDFNDHAATTHDDVIDVLRETIKRHTHDEFDCQPGAH